MCTRDRKEGARKEQWHDREREMIPGEGEKIG